MKNSILTLTLFALSFSPYATAETYIHAALSNPAVQSVLDKQSLQGYGLSEIVNWDAYHNLNPNNELRARMTVYIHNIKENHTRYFYVYYPDGDFTKTPDIDENHLKE